MKSKNKNLGRGIPLKNGRFARKNSKIKNMAMDLAKKTKFPPLLKLYIGSEIIPPPQSVCPGIYATPHFHWPLTHKIIFHT